MEDPREHDLRRMLFGGEGSNAFETSERSVESCSSPPLPPQQIRTGRDENENGCQRQFKIIVIMSGAIPHRTQTAADRSELQKTGKKLPAPTEAPEATSLSPPHQLSTTAQTQAKASSPPNEIATSSLPEGFFYQATISSAQSPHSLLPLKREHRREDTELQQIAHETIWTTARADARAN